MAFIYTHSTTRATRPASDSPSVRHRATFGTAPDCGTLLPVGFNPERYPILSRHWFGTEPRAQPTNGACLRSLASIGHRLPPEPKQIEGGKRH